ncbi:MAG: hypothetical protein QHH06_09695 [Clostridiales bacterium]|jgi:hypothetical protein|nr:hypothetical protein [Eubacteriales bacterium]MDH7566736.1 hypothetical protein [Clostridiales bacterium]
MPEALKGLNFTGPEFIIPALIVLVLLFVIIKISKKLIKLAVFVAIIALAVTVYVNLPTFQVSGSVATLKFKGHEYKVDANNVQIRKEEQDGKEKVFLVSGDLRIELPFSQEYAEKLILDKLKTAQQ